MLPPASSYPFVYGFQTLRALRHHISRLWGPYKNASKGCAAVFDIDNTLVYKTTVGYAARPGVMRLYNDLRREGYLMYAVTARRVRAAAQTAAMLTELGLDPVVLYRDEDAPSSAVAKQNARISISMALQITSGHTSDTNERRIITNVGDQFSDLLRPDAMRRVLLEVSGVAPPPSTPPRHLQLLLDNLFETRPFVLLSGFDETCVFGIKLPSRAFVV